jgi:hypothetical protein
MISHVSVQHVITFLAHEGGDVTIPTNIIPYEFSDCLCIGANCVYTAFTWIACLYLHGLHVFARRS